MDYDVRSVVDGNQDCEFVGHGEGDGEDSGGV